jgi:hypothetical protein
MSHEKHLRVLGAFRGLRSDAGTSTVVESPRRIVKELGSESQKMPGIRPAIPRIRHDRESLGK